LGFGDFYRPDLAEPVENLAESPPKSSPARSSVAKEVGADLVTPSELRGLIRTALIRVGGAGGSGSQAAASRSSAAR